MKKICLVLLSVILFNMAFSQATLKGVVIDGETAETLPGATIMLQGTTKAAMTDLDGKFSISGIAPGKYTVVCQMLSYATKTVTGLELKDKQVESVDFTMSVASAELTEIEVTAEMIKSSQNALLLMQKNSVSVSDGISAETIKRSPDRNTGEVIKRVSGASVQDNRFVVIRGLSDRYNYALLNGAPLPTSEPDRRAFSFDLFPSNMVDNLIINKTASPDMPGEFAGGLIQVNTKDVPEKNFYSLSVSSAVNNQTTFKENYSYRGGKTDWLGIDDGTRALPEGFPSTEEFSALKKKSEKVNCSRLIGNDWGTQQNASTPMNQNYQYSMGHRGKILNNEAGSVFALTYNNSNNTAVFNRRDYNVDDTARIFDYYDTQYSNNVLWGGLWNVSYKIGNNHKIRFNNMYNQNAADRLVMRDGSNYDQEQYMRGTSMQFTSTTLMSSQLNGEHLLPWKNIRLTWNASYASTQRSVPNLRNMVYVKNMKPADESDTLFMANVVAVASPTFAGKFYSEMDEKMYGGRADVEMPFHFFGTKNAIKTGYFQQRKERDFSARILGMVVNDFAKFYMNGGQKLLALPQDSIFAPANISEKGFRIDEITNKSDKYNASSTINATYLMVENNPLNKLRIVWGSRLEVFNQKLNSFAPGAGNNVAPINVDTTYYDILPSLNSSYSLTETSNLRLSASRTVSRPEFRELAPFGFYDFTINRVVIGNSKLYRTNIDNFDLRYEVYPGAGQLFAVTAFYKRFQNPIEMVFTSSGAGSFILGYENANSAEAYGLELELRKNLSFVDSIFGTKAFGSLMFFTNMAYIESKVDLSNVPYAAGSKPRPLQGQSPYLLNTGLQYSFQKIGFNAGVMFNQIGRRIWQVGAFGYLDIYEAQRPLLDVQLSQRFLKNGEVKLNVSNVLNRHQVFYQDVNDNRKFDKGLDNTIISTTSGINISLGLSYNF